MTLSYDEVLERVYGTGLYQIVLAICCSMCSMMLSYEYQSMIFLHYTPSFSCSDSRMQNFSSLRWISSSTFAALSTDPSGMEKMSANYTVEEQCQAVGQRNGTSHMELFSCSKWHFAQSVMRRTLPTDFTLICGRKHLIQWLASSMFFFVAVGQAIALFTDRISRRKMLLLYVVVEIIITSTTQFGTYFEVIFILRLLRMLTMPLNYAATCIMQELLPTRKRGLFGTLYWMPYALGRIARWNRVKLTEDFVEEAVSSIIGSETHNKCPSDGTALTNAGKRKEKGCFAVTDGLIAIFRMPNMRKKAVVLCIYMSAIFLSFYGLSTSQNFASTNIFLNVVCMGLGELPAPFVGWAVAHFFCRRLSVAILAAVTASCVVIGPAVRPLSEISCIVIVFVGKVTASSTVSLTILLVTEIHPTTIRNMGLFLTMSISSVATCLAPVINSLDAIHYLLPGVIYGSAILFCAFLTLLFIPETKRCPLAQRLHQAEKLVRGKVDEWIKFMQTE
ncbi:unnamed protein product [Dibothriocephalus latus]|uniref:Major facilitator superfamily (MFS) profile domain-containing protein n=1 Tax=Dibothriocephalus latus TaxID=60516 RepID=A0A3P7NPX5_DIBLA|nr:unnamed protein product [Dibothriocephalus latus]